MLHNQDKRKEVRELPEKKGDGALGRVSARTAPKGMNPGRVGKVNEDTGRESEDR